MSYLPKKYKLEGVKKYTDDVKLFKVNGIFYIKSAFYQLITSFYHLFGCCSVFFFLFCRPVFCACPALSMRFCLNFSKFVNAIPARNAAIEMIA